MQDAKRHSQFVKKSRRPRDFIQRSQKRSNPLFERQRTQSPIWHRVNKILYAIIAGVIFYLVAYSPLLVITKIRFVGPEYSTDSIQKVIDAQLSERRWLLFPQHNIIFYDSGKTVAAFANHPFLASIRIDKKFPKQLHVFYQLRESVGVIYNQDLYWSVDVDGFILSSEQGLSSDGTGIVINDKYGAYQVGDNVLYGNALEAMLDIWRTIESDYNDVAIVPKEFLVTQNQSDVELRVSEGWRVMFNLNNSIDRQLLVLQQVLQDKISDRSNLEYIDLRVEDWVYYK